MAPAKIFLPFLRTYTITSLPYPTTYEAELLVLYTAPRELVGLFCFLPTIAMHWPSEPALSVPSVGLKKSIPSCKCVDDAVEPRGLVPRDEQSLDSSPHEGSGVRRGVVILSRATTWKSVQEESVVFICA